MHSVGRWHLRWAKDSHEQSREGKSASPPWWCSVGAPMCWCKVWQAHPCPSLRWLDWGCDRQPFWCILETYATVSLCVNLLIRIFALIVCCFREMKVVFIIQYSVHHVPSSSFVQLKTIFCNCVFIVNCSLFHGGIQASSKGWPVSCAGRNEECWVQGGWDWSCRILHCGTRHRDLLWGRATKVGFPWIDSWGFQGLIGRASTSVSQSLKLSKQRRLSGSCWDEW